MAIFSVFFFARMGFLGDRKISSFLILHKFSLEKTKKALYMSYALKNLMPEFFVTLPKDEKFVQFAKTYNLFPLPKLTKNHKRIFVSQVVNPEFFDPDCYISMILQITEICVIHDFNYGVEYIIDYGRFTEKIDKVLTPEKLKKLYIFLEEVYAKRMLPIHGINFNDKAIKFLKACQENLLEANDELYSHFHQGHEVLHQFYSKDILPKDFGGNLKTLAEFREDWIKYLQDNNEYFAKIQNAKVGENLESRKNMETEIARIKEVLNLNGNN